MRIIDVTILPIYLTQHYACFNGSCNGYNFIYNSIWWKNKQEYGSRLHKHPWNTYRVYFICG